MLRKCRAGSEGFTFVDAAAAVLLSAVIAAAVIPLFSVFTRRWPEYQLRRRDAAGLMNLQADLRRELESAEVAYWSEGPGMDESGGGIAWGEGESRVRAVREDRAVSVTSAGLTRRYVFSEAPVLSVLRSPAGKGIGVRIRSAGGTAADVLFDQRRLESAQEEENGEDAGS